MIRRLIHIILTLLLFSFGAKQVAGQEYIWSLPLQYITNMQSINPAYVGMWDKAGLMVLTRVNYVGVSGAPLMQQFSYFTPIKDQKSGIGVNLQRLNLGREKKLFLTGDYSYQIRLDMYNYLRFGFKAGIVNFNNNMTEYQLFPDRIPDPQFYLDVHNDFMTVFGVGAVYFNDNLFISLSVPQIINNTFGVNRDYFSSLPEFKTMYFSGGYVFKLIGDMRLRPNLLLVGTIGDQVRVFADAAAVLYLPGNLQFGANIRSNKSFCLSGQYIFLNNLRLGFAADYAVFSDISRFQVGTYEILIGYDFNLYRRKNVKPNYF